MNARMSTSNYGKSNFVYSDHLEPLQIMSGIKSGEFKQGKLDISRTNFFEGKVICSDVATGEIIIKDYLCLNRALHGDIVAVQIFARHKSSNGVPTGKIVGIVKRSWRAYCGILDNQNRYSRVKIFIPTERRIPRIRIETRQAESLIGQRIVVAIDCWPKNSKYPQGHIVRSLGNIGEKDTEKEVLLLEHHVPHGPFSQAVLNCLPLPDWTIPTEELLKREDLRSLPVCSVDAPGCTNIDDCLHCVPLNDGLGNLEVGVHIADVSYFIRPSTAIDEEASHRGAAVYLCGRRIDMIPKHLSSNLCSLRPKEDRLAFSCIWKLDTNAKIVETRFCKSVIRSKRSLTYEQAQFRIDDLSKSDDVTVGLRGLNSLAKILKARRTLKGALNLYYPQARFDVDSDPFDLQTKQFRDSKTIVEEFMLLANCSAAEHIQREFPECAILRRHPEPPRSNFDTLVNAAKTKDIDLSISTSRELTLSLDAAEQSNSYISTLLRILATRCMQKSSYFCSGLETDFKHYSLAAPIYTYFTSPIRRYADIMVHRLLAASIGADSTYPDLLDKQQIQKLCHHLNFRHRMAQDAKRSFADFRAQMFFREKLVNEQAYILSVRKNAIQVFINKYDLEGTVFLDRDSYGNPVPRNLLSYDEESCKISVNSVSFHAFDKVTVQISHDASNIQHQRINLKLVEPKIEGITVPC